MKLSDRYILVLLISFLQANLINIIFAAIYLSGMVVLRPLIIYDYLAIPILLVLRVPKNLVWFFWSLILAADVLNQISFVYLFSVPEFLTNLEFSFLYNFSFVHYFSLLGVAIFLYLNKLVIDRLAVVSKAKKNITIVTFISLLVITIGLDKINSLGISNAANPTKFTKLNIGGSALKTLSSTIVDFIWRPEQPLRITESVTFQTFGNDDTGNQLLILVESWGLPVNHEVWQILQNELSDEALSAEWNITFGSSQFTGSTTAAELRELCNLKGDYRYLLDPEKADKIETIFTKKKNAGYFTLAVHSFSEKMFERSIWWPNLGIDSIFFLESALELHKISRDGLNYATPFISLNDEDSFAYLQQIADNQPGKKFAYLLTENSHLPYLEKLEGKRDSINIKFYKNLTPEAVNQMSRIFELLKHFIHNTSKGGWSKILIMGDHMPPFSKKADREFYSDKYIPYFVLSK